MSSIQSPEVTDDEFVEKVVAAFKATGAMVQSDAGANYVLAMLGIVAEARRDERRRVLEERGCERRTKRGTCADKGHYTLCWVCRWLAEATAGEEESMSDRTGT